MGHARAPGVGLTSPVLGGSLSQPPAHLTAVCSPNHQALLHSLLRVEAQPTQRMALDASQAPRVSPAPTRPQTHAVTSAQHPGPVRGLTPKTRGCTQSVVLIWFTIKGPSEKSLFAFHVQGLERFVHHTDSFFFGRDFLPWLDRLESSRPLEPSRPGAQERHTG